MVHRLLMRHDDVPQVQGVAAGEVDQRTDKQTVDSQYDSVTVILKLFSTTRLLRDG